MVLWLRSARRCALAWLFSALVAGCAGGLSSGGLPRHAAPEPVVISIVGTNDLHGRVGRVAVLAGFVENLRARRRADGGAVLLVDAGDLFQGTLESNLGEGEAVIALYNALGYTAAAVGNHEFDFGPEGASPTAGLGEDPRGALKARARQARFPFLAANIIDDETGRPIAWENMQASVLVEASGVKVGLVGVTTEDTPRTTLAANFRGLSVRPLAAALAKEAAQLRAQGAAVVVALAHAGGRCGHTHDPQDLTSCREDGEIFEVARALPRGTVDVIVAGHTHAPLAHEVNGVAIVEAFALGRAFGRVDVIVAPGDRRPREVRIFPPQDICAAPQAALGACAPGPYEGSPVRIDTDLLALAAPAFAQAEARRREPLGVLALAPVTRAYARESALGNLFADLMREASPDVDGAIMNGGGVRADLPGGLLNYGDLFEAFPFDNRFATVRLSGAQLKRVIAANLERPHGILLFSGLEASAVCGPGGLEVSLRRAGGAPVADDEPLVVVTSDFLADGGDAAFGVAGLEPGSVRIGNIFIREAMAERLRARGGALDPGVLFDAERPRVVYPGERPVRCAAER